MKRLMMAAATAALMSGSVGAETKHGVKIGILLGYTGPIESLTPPMAKSAEAAIAEVNSSSGFFLGGMTVGSVRADTTCSDSAAANAAAERLITSDRVHGIVGSACSGATVSTLTNVAVPNGMVMISPASTSPALSQIENNGLFFRTAPSDSRQGEIMTEVIMDRGFREVSVTYTNNDYGKGLADSFRIAFESAGGIVNVSISHEDGKADYTAEVGALSAAGGQALVVIGYSDQGGRGIIEASLDSGAFETFVLPDGMVSNELIRSIGSDMNGSFGQMPGSDGSGLEMLNAMGHSGPFVAESYDAAALVMLAMQSAGSIDPKIYKEKIIEVANAPGEIIHPGQLGKALEMLAAGTDINYQGASDVEFVSGGDNVGRYREIEVKDELVSTVRFR
jgi:branched-chain amino acid transport system substrate-binding protein